MTSREAVQEVGIVSVAGVAAEKTAEEVEAVRIEKMIAEIVGTEIEVIGGIGKIGEATDETEIVSHYHQLPQRLEKSTAVV